MPPHASTQLVFAVHPGDAVTIRRVKMGPGPASAELKRVIFTTRPACAR